MITATTGQEAVLDMKLLVDDNLAQLRVGRPLM